MAPPQPRIKAFKAYQGIYDKISSSILNNPSLLDSLVEPSVSQYTAAGRTAFGLRRSPKFVLAEPAKTLSMAQIIESTDAIQSTLGDLKTAAAESSTGAAGKSLSTQYEQLEKEAIEASNLAKSATEPGEASQGMTDYYESIVDLKIVSGELGELTKEVIAGVHNPLWESVKGMWTTIKDAVVAVGVRIKGMVGGAASEVLDALDTLKSVIGEKLDAIGDALDKLAHRLYDLIISLIGRMFDFAQTVAGEAKKRGFTFKELSLEFPTFEFEALKVGIFSIPIPKSFIPKLTVTFK